MYLIDTNVFLEILLTQERGKECKRFLDAAIGNLCISDFSLHSIGVILFRSNKEDIFQKFANDVIPEIKIIALSLEIVIMDSDFKVVKGKVKIIFLGEKR